MLSFIFNVFFYKYKKTNVMKSAYKKINIFYRTLVKNFVKFTVIPDYTIDQMYYHKLLSFLKIKEF